ncbi:MAG: hypothetical protein ACLVG9_05950 [Eubacteriales bacterium]
MANNLDGILKSMNRTKLEELKKKAENGELAQMLDSVDTNKAEKMIADLGLAEKTKNVDLGKLMNEVKKNPDILKELKKLF